MVDPIRSEAPKESPRVTTQEDDTTRVCHDCVGDPFLADEVREEGARGLCSYCGKTREALTLGDLADRIHEVLQGHFELTPSEPSGDEFALAREGLWERPGYPVADVIADMAGLSEEIAGDVVEILSDRHSYQAVRDAEDDPYGSDALYEERGPDDWDFRDTWAAFCSEIRSRARFFSNYAEEALGSIFGDLTTHRASGDRPVIREITPDDEDRFVWRARKAQSTKGLKAILKSPAREIGPPPSRLAKGGRMNAPGIPVFYGAMEESTCVAEARAPVGSHVVVARFELLRPVRLLDFDALTEVYVEGSHFDPDYATREGRAAFLRRLVREISRPVMPQDEAFEYLTTQAVAEYLANKVEPRLDGIIFHSSQTGGTGRNLVLFNHACGVAPYDLPEGTEVTFLIRRADEDDEDDEDGDITVFETVPADPPEDAAPSAPREIFADLMDVFFSPPRWDKDGDEEDEPPTYGDPTLRLDLGSVVVLDIKNVQYGHNRRDVIRHRSTKGEERDF